MNTLKRQRLIKNREESSSSQTTIYDLPESILIHILSFLPTTDAAILTSVVALPWRHLWHSLPVINFDIEAFHFRGPTLIRAEAREVFAEMINTTLFQRPDHFALKKFILTLDYMDYDYLRSYVDSWLKFVIRLKPEEIDLDFKEWVEYDYEFDDEEYYTLSLLEPYVFRYTALVNSSVKVLRLRACSISRSPGIPSPSKVSSLRELHLTLAYFVSEEFARLLDSCVNLEVLRLEKVDFVGDWKLESKSLKHFRFRGNCVTDLYGKSIEICAPKLKTMWMKDRYDGMYSFKSTSSLFEAYVEFPARTWRDFVNWTNMLSSLGGVEVLGKENMWCRSMFGGQKMVPLGQNLENLAKYPPAEGVFSETFVFRNLKNVELVTGLFENDIRGLEILLRKCPLLEIMTLVNIHASPKQLKKLAGVSSFYQLEKMEDLSVVLQMPRLRIVAMKMFLRSVPEMFVVGLLKKYGVCLEKILAFPEKRRPYVLWRP